MLKVANIEGEPCAPQGTRLALPAKACPGKRNTAAAGIFWVVAVSLVPFILYDRLAWHQSWLDAITGWIWIWVFGVPLLFLINRAAYEPSGRK